MQGRKVPDRTEEKHERSLILIATKGVVQLFNTVSEFQVTNEKQALREEKDKNVKYSEMIQNTGNYANTSNKNIIEKLQNKQNKWKILNADEDNESEVDSEGNIKIKEYTSD